MSEPTFRPCVSMSAAAAKAQFLARLDLGAAGELLEAAGIVGEARVSSRLGLLKGYGEQQSLLLFESGEVTARPFPDAEAAVAYLRRLGGVLWEAQLCPESGLAVRGCARECTECWAAAKGRIRMKDERDDA